MSERIAIVGLGYVGLPVAVSFARQFSGVIGFDISAARIEALRAGDDWTCEVSSAALGEARLTLTTDPKALAGVTFFVVTVPTPIDEQRRPDLRPLESSVYDNRPVSTPGCRRRARIHRLPGSDRKLLRGRLLAAASGLICGKDFKLAYSPERINPGDEEHRLENIVKIVAGEDVETFDRVASVYRSIIDAKVHRASSVKVAEAAKVLEKQRDLNIALMNELAIILDRMGVPNPRCSRCRQATKWNFLPFAPGFVGGRCVGVDPYYLTAAAEAHGYHPQIILAGRRVNDGMGGFVARKLIKLLIDADLPVKSARVGILGLTFKEDVPTCATRRWSTSSTSYTSSESTVSSNDAHATAEEAMADIRVALTPLRDFGEIDAIVLAVNHLSYRDQLDLIQGEDRPRRDSDKCEICDDAGKYSARHPVLELVAADVSH